MNAIRAKDQSVCGSRSVMLYADGEIEPAHIVEVESHLVACARCKDELDTIRAMRASLRRSITRRTPDAVADKLRMALCGEESAAGSRLGRRSSEVSSSGVGRGVSSERGFSDGVEAKQVMLTRPGLSSSSERSRAWVAAAVAMAACFVLVVVVLQSERGTSAVIARSVATIDPAAVMGSGAAANDDAPSFDVLLDKLVALHANPLPPEERNPEQLARLEPYVGVPVKRSALTLLRDLGVGQASFDGARIHPMRDSHSCAALHYKLEGHRLTVYVFDPRMVQLARTKLRTRMVEESPVYVGRMRGFSVAAAEKRGVGYALASDMDEDRSLKMVASF